MAINYKDTEVTVKVGEKDFSKTYSQVIKADLTTDDLLSLMQKDAKQVIADYWYGSDLRAKASVRQSILASVAGPDKAFMKAVKDFMNMMEAMNNPITEEKAKEVIKAAADAQKAKEIAEPVEA